MSVFDRLPDDSRIWIFALCEDPGPEKLGYLKDGLEKILGQWKTHGTLLTGAAEVAADRFLIVAANEEQAAASGCSIDSLNKSIRALAAEAGIKLAPYDAVFYRDNGRVVQADRGEFGKLVSGGKIGPQTIVFDNSITKLSQFKEGKWELPFAESWHSKAF